MAEPRVRHHRQEVLERTEREFRALDGLVSGLGPEDWQRPVPRPETRDPWTIKDALAHVVYWKLRTARVIRGEKHPPDERGLNITQLNQLIYERWRDRSPEEVLEWHREVQADVMRTLSAKSDEWFARREHARTWPGDFDSHSAAHRTRDIEAALVSG